VVIITDAPPHGLGERGDNIPQGIASDKYDPVEIGYQFSERSIAVHCVCCFPTMHNYQRAASYYEALSTRTNGRCIALSEVSGMAAVLLGTIAEEAYADSMVDRMTKMAAELGKQGLSAEEAVVQAFDHVSSSKEFANHTPTPHFQEVKGKFTSEETYETRSLAAFRSVCDKQVAANPAMAAMREKSVWSHKPDEAPMDIGTAASYEPTYSPCDAEDGEVTFTSASAEDDEKEKPVTRGLGSADPDDGTASPVYRSGASFVSCGASAPRTEATPVRRRREEVTYGAVSEAMKKKAMRCASRRVASAE